MSISLLLEMASSSDPDRTAVVSGDMRLTTNELSALADGGAGVIAASGAQHVAYVGTGGAMLPLLLFSAARAGVAVTPLNYRLSADGLRELIDRLPDTARHRRRRVPRRRRGRGQAGDLLGTSSSRRPAPPNRPPSSPTPTSVAVVLFTSGTTSRPKAVELTHNNLTSYVTGTVEFDSASPADAALICVPPYHIAGVSAALSNLYAGRKMVYLTNFDAREWVRLVARRGRHHPRRSCRPCSTASSPHWKPISRAADAAHRWPTADPRSRCHWCARRCRCCPSVGFVNAYGLTETSSTDRGAHARRPPRRAWRPPTRRSPGGSVRSVNRCPASRCRSAPRTEPSSAQAKPASCSSAASRCRASTPASVRCSTTEGWFPTKDVAFLDEDGYLFIGGRSDDTIIRGGENIAPAEIEDVLVEHPARA